MIEVEGEPVRCPQVAEIEKFSADIRLAFPAAEIARSHSVILSVIKKTKQARLPKSKNTLRDAAPMEGVPTLQIFVVL